MGYENVKAIKHDFYKLKKELIKLCLIGFNFPFGFNLISPTLHIGIYSDFPYYCEFEVIVGSSIFLLTRILLVAYCQAMNSTSPWVFQSHLPSQLDAKISQSKPENQVGNGNGLMITHIIRMKNFASKPSGIFQVV